MKQQRFELHINSVLLGDEQRWALYAVPDPLESKVQRVDYCGLRELDHLLSKLRKIGVEDSVLWAARRQLSESNLSYLVGTYPLTDEDCEFLGLESAPRLTASHGQSPALTGLERKDEGGD